MEIVVQKYGGTSVGNVSRIHQVAARIAKQACQINRRIAVVVSAMAGETDRLIDLVAQINPDAQERLKDMALSAGEQVSVALLAAAIEAQGVSARAYLGFQIGILTDSFHSRARIKEIKTDKIEACWESGIIPVIAGFQGVTDEMEITTLGRGGSDTSAVALAVALGADYCEINTDVDGVFTANPREIPAAKLIETMDYEVALEMASLGSKVLHSRCVELAAKFDLPLVVRNSFKPDETKRTRIMRLSEKQAIEAPVVSGVSLEHRVARVAIEGISNKSSSYISDIFNQVAEQGINVDIIVHNRSTDGKTMRIGFTVNEDDLDRTIKQVLTNQGREGFEALECNGEPQLVKLSVVGLGMLSHHGVASRVFSTLTAEGIELQMITTSEIKISCVLAKDHAEQASKLLHQEFIEK